MPAANANTHALPRPAICSRGLVSAGPVHLLWLLLRLYLILPGGGLVSGLCQHAGGRQAEDSYNGQDLSHYEYPSLGGLSLGVGNERSRDRLQGRKCLFSEYPFIALGAFSIADRQKNRPATLTTISSSGPSENTE
jgi:hypothetical protein